MQAHEQVVLTNATAGQALPHSVFRYAYDANGNRTQQVEIQPGTAFGTETTSYAYDSSPGAVRSMSCAGCAIRW